MRIGIILESIKRFACKRRAEEISPCPDVRAVSAIAVQPVNIVALHVHHASQAVSSALAVLVGIAPDIKVVLPYRRDYGALKIPARGYGITLASPVVYDVIVIQAVRHVKMVQLPAFISCRRRPDCNGNKPACSFI